MCGGESQALWRQDWDLGVEKSKMKINHDEEEEGGYCQPNSFS